MSDYVPTAWVDGVTPINATNLNHIEQAVDEVQSRVKIPTPLQEGRWLTVTGGAVVWAPLVVPPGITYEGTWAAGTTYQPGMVVRYNGIDYLAVNPSTGSTPPPP